MEMTNQDCRAVRQLQALLDAVVVHPPDHFSWFGVRWSTPALRTREARFEADQRALLHDMLARQLYEDFYCVGRPRRAESGAGRWFSESRNSAFVQELAAANHGHGPWHSGWTVEDNTADPLLVRRDGLSLLVPARRVRGHANGAAVPHEDVEVLMPKELLGMSPGYYMAVGDRDLLGEPEGTIARFYWSSTQSTAPLIVSALTETLNGLGFPFRLKALKSPDMYERCDAVVLYVRKAQLHDIRPVVEQVYSTVQRGLRPDVPALTKWIAPGLAAADDPQDDESFGTHRCKLIASALINAPADRAGPDAAMEAVAAAFASAGLNVDRPYLEPSEPDDYEELSAGRAARAAQTPRGPGWAPPPFLVARKIGDWLVGSAQWQGDICNWIGGSPVDLPEIGDPAATASGSLDGDVFGGTSGIAMFLAQLATVSVHTASIRSTALGAIRHALLTANMVDGGHRWGLFDGAAGIGLVACHVGRLLSDDDVAQRGCLLLERLAALRSVPAETDLISGTAGAILALLIFKRLHPDNADLDAAVRFGEALVESGHRRRGVLCWPTSTVGGKRVGLTGMSHGAAGIGMALAELGVATGIDRFLSAAEQAFAYERAFFDATRSNWADLRWYGGARANRRWASYAPYWCHGAAGIALSRLRSGALGMRGCFDEADHGLGAAKAWLDQATARGGESVVLCHGVLGNAEVLRLADRTPGRGQPGFADTVRSAERHVRTQFAGEPSTWPCQGAGGLLVPGLMCGLAGVGYFYLRSVAPNIPTILLPVADTFEPRNR